MPVPLHSGCIIQVSIPSDFTGLHHLVEEVQIQGMFGFIRSVPYTLLANNVVKIYDACLSYADNSFADATIKIKYLQNPAVVTDTQSFEIQITDKDERTVALTQEAIILTASQFTPGEFQDFNVIASNPTVQEASSLTVSLRSTNRLSE